MAPPFRQAEFDIMFGSGISKEGILIDMAVNCDIINKSGAWFSYKDQKLGQGKENVRTFLIQNPEVAMEIEQLILQKYGLAEIKE